MDNGQWTMDNVFMVKKYRAAVSVLVLRSSRISANDPSRILLVHKPRTMDAWQLPQGGIEEGETVEQAALRELQEETALVFSAVTFMSSHSYTYDFPPEYIERFHPRNAGQTLSFVVVDDTGNAPVTVDQKEVDDHAWIATEGLGRYLSRPAYLHVVQDVLREYAVRKSTT